MTGASPSRSVKQRAVDALAARLRDLLPDDRRAAMPTPRHAPTFEDNLLPTVTAGQAAAARAFLEQGDGHELEPGPNGEPPDAHAAHSSATAAVNLFGAWLGRDEALTIPGIDGGFTTVKLEAKVPFQRGGRPPNLDALLLTDGVAAGVESKLTEYLDRHNTPRKWQPSIGRLQNLALLAGKWRARLEDAIASAAAPKHLESGQLLRHALGLQRRHGQQATHLVYLYWEPADADAEPVIARHRAEIAAFAAQVGTGAPHFHALPHLALIAHWDTPDAPGWLREHCAAWRQRYVVAVGNSATAQP